jgi:hypothetical protein
MRWQWGLLSLFLLTSSGFAQEAIKKPLDSGDAAPINVDLQKSSPAVFPSCAAGESDAPGGFLDGNHHFDNFIGFMSNPLQNIDPRAATEVIPLYESGWITSRGALASGNLQVVGPGINVALSERLAVGLNQGGYAVADFDSRDNGRFRDRFGILRSRRPFAGQREGWLNFGGYAQYTVIEDVPDQFLATVGMRLETPTGSKSLFQGGGPAVLAPYVTVGKECGDYHFLATSGYQFPTGSGNKTTNLFYTNVHFDRKIGCIYPLVEFNWSYHTSSVDVDLPTRRGFINFGDFESTGNIVTVAAGADAVLIKNRLEFGAVYATPIATQRDFNANVLLVKMVFRY